jgi:hypothetical protein
MYISADISKILTLSRTVDDLNKKGLAKMMANPFQNNAGNPHSNSALPVACR